MKSILVCRKKWYINGVDILKTEKRISIQLLYNLQRALGENK